MCTSSDLSSILDRIDNGTHTEADLTALRRAIEAGKIKVEGDVTDSVIITGHGNDVRIEKGASLDALRNLLQTFIYKKESDFLIDNKRLQDSYISPQPVFERVNLDNFVGREWLIKEVDRFIEKYDCGIFILEAGAGIGKTAFLAHLVQQCGYIHHFIENSPGVNGIAVGIRNLVGQIILEWKLDPYFSKGFLPHIASQPEVLQTILDQAAQKRNEEKPGENIILVVDALDEAGTPYNRNVMGLPVILPKGVYLIVSKRPVQISLTVECPRRVLKLDPEDKQNIDDMRVSLEKLATSKEISSILKETKYTQNDFVSIMLEKSRGVWIYLHYLIKEIELNGQLLLVPQTLPDGLFQYFARYWMLLRDNNENTWDNAYLPILSILSVTQEAVSLGNIIKWLDIEINEIQLNRLLTVQWKPFITVIGGNSKKLYRFYHATLNDFFHGKISIEQLTNSEQVFVSEIASATLDAHNRLANHYIGLWGGLKNQLPGLSLYDLMSENGYGIRYLPLHLAQANRDHDLHQLLALEDQHSRNIWYEIKQEFSSVNDYLSDINLAWSLGEKGANSSRSLSLQFRYALITATIKNLVIQMPINLLLVLLELKIWGYKKVLSCLNQISDLNQYYKYKSALAIYFGKRGEKHNAIENLRDIHSIEHIIKVVTILAPFMADDLIDVVQDYVNSDCVNCIEPIIPYLSDRGIREVWKILSTTQKSINSSNVIRIISHRLPNDLIVPAYKLICPSRFLDYLDTFALLTLFHRLPDDLQKKNSKNIELLIERTTHHKDADNLVKHIDHLPNHLQLCALNQIEKIENSYEKSSYHYRNLVATNTLVEVSSKYAELHEMKKALSTALLIADNQARSELLQKLSQDKQFMISIQTRFKEAKLPSYYELFELAPFLPLTCVEKALEIIGTLQRTEILNNAFVSDEMNRDERNTKTAAWSRLLARFAELGNADEAFSQIQTITAFSDWEVYYQLSRTIRDIAPYLSHALLEKALDISDQIEGSYLCRAKAFEGIIPYLPSRLLKKALLKAWTIFDDEWHQLAIKRFAELGFYKEALSAACGDYFWMSKPLYKVLSPNGKEYNKIISSIASYLPKEVIIEIFTESLRTRDWEKLLAISSALETHEKKKLLRAIQKISDNKTKSKFLLQFRSYLNHDLFELYVISIMSISDCQIRVRTLNELIQVMTFDELENFLSSVHHLENANSDQETNANYQKLTIDGCIKSVQNIGDLEEQVNAINKVIDKLPKYFATYALRNARNSQTITELAVNYAKLGESEEALTAIRNLGKPEDIAFGLLAMLPYVRKDQQLAILYESRDIGKKIDINQKEHRFHVFSGIAFHFIEYDLPHEADNSIQNIREIEGFSEALGLIAPHLPEKFLDKELTEIFSENWLSDEYEDKWSLAMILASLVPYLPQKTKNELKGFIQILINELECSHSYMPWYLALVELAYLFPEERRDSIIKKILPNLDCRYASYVPFYAKIISKLPNSFIKDVIKITETHASQELSARIFLELIPLMDGKWRKYITNKVLTILGSFGVDQQLEILADKISLLPEEEKIKLIEKVILEPFPHIFHFSREEYPTSRIKAIVELSPYLSEEILEDTKAVIMDGNMDNYLMYLSKISSQECLFNDDELYAYWKKTIHESATIHERDEFLNSFKNLWIVIETISEGNDALIQSSQAIIDVSRWWP